VVLCAVLCAGLCAVLYVARMVRVGRLKYSCNMYNVPCSDAHRTDRAGWHSPAQV